MDRRQCDHLVALLVGRLVDNANPAFAQLAIDGETIGEPASDEVHALPVTTREVVGPIAPAVGFEFGHVVLTLAGDGEGAAARR